MLPLRSVVSFRYPSGRKTLIKAYRLLKGCRATLIQRHSLGRVFPFVKPCPEQIRLPVQSGKLPGTALRTLNGPDVIHMQSSTADFHVMRVLNMPRIRGSAIFLADRVDP
jgi:hypothetical protein